MRSRDLNRLSDEPAPRAMVSPDRKCLFKNRRGVSVPRSARHCKSRFRPAVAASDAFPSGLPDQPSPDRGEPPPQHTNVDLCEWRSKSAQIWRRVFFGPEKCLLRRQEQRSNSRPHDRHHRPAVAADDRRTWLHPGQRRRRNERYGSTPLTLQVCSSE